MLKKLVVHWLLAIALVVMPMFITACSERKSNPLGLGRASTDSLFSGIGRADDPHMNATDWRGFAWAYGDWSSRVAWEARYALSRSANGASAWPVSDDSWGKRWLGDWDYVSSDTYARDQAKKEAKNQYGTYIGDYDGHHCGGTCTWFVRLILYRATYWSGHGVHLTTPNFPNSVYSWCDWAHMTRDWNRVSPGWVASSPQNHMAIFDSRATVNGRLGWYVIDSNYVGGAGKEWIGKHFMPDSRLTSENYWAWSPTWATTN